MEATAIATNVPDRVEGNRGRSPQGSFLSRSGLAASRRVASMSYAGGKEGPGVFQTIINLMPSHSTYIEPFLGNAAVMRHKKPARLNIGVDLDPAAPGLAWLKSQGIRSRGKRMVDVFAGDQEYSIAESADSAGDNARSGDECRQASPLSEMVAASVRNGDGRSRSRKTALAQKHEQIETLITVVMKIAEDPGILTRDPIDTDYQPEPLQEGIHYRSATLNGIDLLQDRQFMRGKIPPVLVYCDPPYLMETRSGKRLYKHEMEAVDHRRLLRVIQDLPCYVMISGYFSQLYADELKGWNATQFQTMTRGGKKATEWVWFNFPRPETTCDVHDLTHLGRNFREREKLKRQQKRWVERLRRMSPLQRQALLNAIAATDEDGEATRS